MDWIRLFLNKDGTRKSTLALKVFFLTLAFFAVYFIAYANLIEFLYRNLFVVDENISSIIHSIIISVVGTAVCLLFFFLPDKRLVPLAYLGVAIVFIIFLFVALYMKTVDNDALVNLTMSFGLAPTFIGNLLAWSIYINYFEKGN